MPDVVSVRAATFVAARDAVAEVTGAAANLLFSQRVGNLFSRFQRPLWLDEDR